jgi:hypothetical protein
MGAIAAIVTTGCNLLWVVVELQAKQDDGLCIASFVFASNGCGRRRPSAGTNSSAIVVGIGAAIAVLPGSGRARCGRSGHRG